MTMVPVESNHLQAVGHDPDKSELHVQFKNGAHYVYANVSADEHAALMASESKGQHLQEQIKPSKGCTRK